MDESKPIEKSEKARPPQLWKKGQSGNPNGRPKKEFTFTTAIKKAMEEKGRTGDVTKLEELIEVLYTKGLAGDVKAIEILIERVDGKALQQVEISKKEEYVLTWGDEPEEDEEVIDGLETTNLLESGVENEEENSS